ncbi:MAG: hypothetical protein M1818_000277 [Claussenomyces sp. TS43310]|nr:MAG: hypothetical protein M1818_000277 [Claussenomyces sp. TS43310]
MRQSRPAPSSPEDGRHITLPPVRFQNEPEHTGRRDDVREGVRGSHGPQPIMQTQPGQVSLPPYTVLTTSSSESQPPLPSISRGLGVHTILNPSEPQRVIESPRSRPSGFSQSPHPMHPPFQRQGSPAVLPRESTQSQQPASLTTPSIEGRGTHPFGRKMLQPKSPRSVSLGARKAATIDVQQSPFVPSGTRGFTADPGPSFMSEMPPIPRVPGMIQNAPPSLPQASGSPADLRRRASVATMSAPSRAPFSQSASPSPSLTSSYSSQPSPVSRQQIGPSAGTVPYFPGASFGAPMPGGAQGAPGSEGPYLPPDSVYVESSGPGQSSNFKMMSIAAEGGGHFYVPVDVQAASKVADEKRARNAGASARFRERKKAKEREASTNIQKLEQQTRELERKARELEQERNFYRGERDRFREIVYMNPSTRDLATQAPPSPRHTRAQTQTRVPTFVAPPASASYVDPAGGLSQEKDASGRPPRRRRMDAPGEYTYAQLGPSSPPPLGASFASNQPLSGLPPLGVENVSASGPRTGGAVTSSIQPTTMSPYETASQNIYERSWAGRPEDQTK